MHYVCSESQLYESAGLRSVGAIEAELGDAPVRTRATHIFSHGKFDKLGLLQIVVRLECSDGVNARPALNF